MARCLETPSGRYSLEVERCELPRLRFLSPVLGFCRTIHGLFLSYLSVIEPYHSWLAVCSPYHDLTGLRGAFRTALRSDCYVVTALRVFDREVFHRWRR